MSDNDNDDDEIETDREYDKRWHIDKRVPLAMLLAIAIQSAGLIWWLSSLGERVNTLERNAASSSAIAMPQSDRLTRVEVKLDSLKEGLLELKDLIRRPSIPGPRSALD